MKFKFPMFIFLLFGLYSCHKKTETSCPPPKIISVPTLNRQFNFKVTSKWVYKNSSSGATDTVSGYIGDGFKTYQPTGRGCPRDYLESYYCELSHGFFPASNTTFSYWYTNSTTPAFMNVFQGNVGDSIIFSGNATQYIKLENHFSSLVINGATFIDVYQMFYFPDLQGFKRLWWCPSIGIVQCEFVNSTTHLTENWAVTSYSVQLY